MRKLFFYFIFIASFLLTGCQDIGFDSNGRYKMEKDKSGQLIVLDTKKGAVEIIENGIKIKVQEEEQAGKIKELSDQTIPGLPVEISNLKIKYRNGTLLYKGNIQPIIADAKKIPNEEKNTEPVIPRSDKFAALFPKLEALWDSESKYDTKEITILLNDKDNFNVSKFTIDRGDLTRVVNNEAKPMYFSFEGSQNINLRAYATISNYNFTWYLGKWSAK